MIRSLQSLVAREYAALRVALLALLPVMLFAACLGPFAQDNNADEAGTAVGTLRVAPVGPVTGQTVLPDLLAAVEDYEVTLSLDGFPSRTTSGPSGPFEFTDIPVGTWTVAVAATNVSSEVIARGSVAIEVVRDGSNAVSVPLSPVQGGAGNVEVSVSWPAGRIDGVEAATLTPEGGSAIDITAVSGISGDTWTYTEERSSGNYRLLVRFTRDGVHVATIVDGIQVYDNVTAQGSIVLKSEEIGRAPTAPADADLTAVATSGSRIEIDWEDSSTVESGYEVQWSPNGVDAWSLLVSTSVNETAAQHLGLSGGTYHYRVRAVNAFGASDWATAEATIVSVTGVTVDPTSVALTTSETAQANADVFPADATEAGVSWFSSNADVATVDAFGLITATGPGNATITATTDDGGFSDSLAVDVTAGGILDTDFGGTGYVVHDNAAGGEGTDQGLDLVIDSQDRVLVAGASNNGSDADLALWRFDPDGSFDISFTGDGYTTQHNAGGGDDVDRGYGLVVDTEDRILVGGESDRDSGQAAVMAVWRFNSDGGLDTDFDDDGYAVDWGAAGTGGSGDRAYDLAVDGSGRVLAAGYSNNGSYDELAVWRYTSAGAPDGSLNGTGYLSDDGLVDGNENDYGYGIAVDSSGRIVVAGASHNGSDYDAAVWRFDSDGSPDTSFGTNGLATHHGAAGGAGDDFGRDLTFAADGKILVAGYSSNGSNDDLVVWRFDTDGTLDDSFSNDGFVVHGNAAGGDGDDIGYAITSDAEGKILVTGSSAATDAVTQHRGERSESGALIIPVSGQEESTPSEGDMALWRFNSDGTLDTSFGAGSGYVTHDGAAGGSGSDTGYGIVVDAVGRIVVTGSSSNGVDDDMVVWRYE